MAGNICECNLQSHARTPPRREAKKALELALFKLRKLWNGLHYETPESKHMDVEMVPTGSFP